MPVEEVGLVILRRRSRRLALAGALALLITVACFDEAARADAAPDGSWGSRAEGQTVSFRAITGHRYGSPGLPHGAPTEFSAAAVIRWLASPPPSVPDGCLGQILSGQWVDDICPLVSTPAQPASDDVAAFVPPSTVDIIYQAVASATVPNAGLVVQPEGVSYTGIPALVHASRTSSEITVEILGRQTTVSLTARSFSFDFGDGTRPLVTTAPGSAYPDRTNQHTYTSPAAQRVIELVTTWTATATNPFTGETQSVEGILQTREVSAPFEVRDSHTVLTDVAEQRLGR